MKKTREDFVQDQKMPIPPVYRADLTGKVIIVIGANVGLGYEAAKHFASMSPEKLVLGVRSEEKGKEAKTKIEEETGCKTIEVGIIDLSSFDSVKSFAQKVEKENDRLDILLENAACTSPETVKTSDGWEQMLQVNCLSQELLALLLLPMMLRTAKSFSTIPRLVVVASEVHFWVDFPFDKLEDHDKGFHEALSDSPGENRYGVNKTLNIFFVRALASRLASSPIIVITVNPGFCVSQLRRNITGERAETLKKAEDEIGHTTEEGSRQLVFGAIGKPEDGDENLLRGQYINRSLIEEVNDIMLDERGIKAHDLIWNDMIQVLNKIDERVPGIVTEHLRVTNH